MLREVGGGEVRPIRDGMEEQALSQLWEDPLLKDVPRHADAQMVDALIASEMEGALHLHLERMGQESPEGELPPQRCPDHFGGSTKCLIRKGTASGGCSSPQAVRYWSAGQWRSRSVTDLLFRNILGATHGADDLRGI